MKQLLYIPSGKFFLFFNEQFHIMNISGISYPTWSIEEYFNHEYHRYDNIEQVVIAIISGTFSRSLYNFCDVPTKTTDNGDEYMHFTCLGVREEFELIDV